MLLAATKQAAVPTVQLRQRQTHCTTEPNTEAFEGRADVCLQSIAASSSIALYPVRNVRAAQLPKVLSPLRTDWHT